MSKVTKAYGLVAPHAGAWIETGLIFKQEPNYGSHPTRVRGLKQRLIILKNLTIWSHPTRVRGLKLQSAELWGEEEFGRTPRGCVD